MFDPRTWRQIETRVRKRLDERINSLQSSGSDKDSLERIAVRAMVDRAVIVELKWVLGLEEVCKHDDE